jgi:hypothetical protein
MTKLTAAPFAATVVLGAFTPAVAPSAISVEFNGLIHFCSSSPAEVIRVTPGGTVHIRGATNTNLWATNSPYVDGPETNEVASINFNRQGDGNVVLHVSLDPLAFDGTWEITQKVTVGEEGGLGRGVGHGTGELRGMTIKFNTGARVLGANPCSDLPSVMVQGTILSSAS